MKCKECPFYLVVNSESGYCVNGIRASVEPDNMACEDINDVALYNSFIKYITSRFAEKYIDSSIYNIDGLKEILSKKCIEQYGIDMFRADIESKLSEMVSNDYNIEI